MQVNVVSGQSLGVKDGVKAAGGGSGGDGGAFDAAVAQLMAVLSSSRQEPQRSGSDAGSRGKSDRDSGLALERLFNQAVEGRSSSGDGSRGNEANVSQTRSGNGADRGNEGSGAVSTGQGQGVNEANNGSNGTVAAAAEEGVKGEGNSPKAVQGAVTANPTGEIPAELRYENRGQQQQGDPLSQRVNRMWEQMVLRGNTGEGGSQAQGGVQGQGQAGAQAASAVGEVPIVGAETPKAGNLLALELAIAGEREGGRRGVSERMPGQESSLYRAMADLSNVKGETEQQVRVVVAESQEMQRQGQQQQQQQQQQLQQQNSNLAGQRAQENAQMQYKPETVPVTAGAEPVAVNSQVMPDKAEPTGNLNTLQPGAHQVGQAGGEAVTMAGLRDRVLMEIRQMYQSLSENFRQTQVQLRLHPEQLGQLTIRLLFQKGGEITAHFYASNSSVKEVLESSMQQLRNTFSQQDLKLGETQVFLNNGFLQQQDQAGWDQSGGGRGVSGINGNNLYQGDSDEVDQSQAGYSKDGIGREVNYLV